jgi:hypothetical protein
MAHKGLVALAAAAALVTAFSVLPADAASKKKERPYRADSTSLDGRVLGWPRTCGHDYMQYDFYGVPVGPYCH